MASAAKPAGDRRVYKRFRHRLSCDLHLDGTDHKGFLVEVSARGLFVETRATADEGTAVSVRLRPSNGEPVEVLGRIARVRKAHRAVKVVRTPGLGIEVTAADEPFFALVMRLLAEEGQPGAPG